jgi:hypothetical protein
MVCPANSSYSFRAIALIFCRMFIHIEHICSFFVTFFSASIDGRDLIFGHKLHIGTKYQISAINSCWEKCDEKCAYMFNVYKNQLSRQTGSRNLTGPKMLPTIFLDPSDSYFLFADLVGCYTHWTYMHIFRHIFLSNYWWQRSDIRSQASYRYHSKRCRDEEY